MFSQYNELLEEIRSYNDCFHEFQILSYGKVSFPETRYITFLG